MDQRFGPYQVGETIGRGTFAKVKVAVHEATKTKVALKVIPRKVMEEDPKSEIKIKREIKILQVLRHPHVMRLYDVVQTKHDIILVLEYVSGGELFDYISRRGRLHESMARVFFQQLIAAVGYCHTYNVAHRDLKPENILLEQNMKSIKIGDFGLSSIMRDGKLFDTSCGTPNYAAPEVVGGRLYSGKEADVWSCGVVLYTMLAGGLPFDDPYVNILFKKIQTANYQVPSFVPKGAQDLIGKLLEPDPLERATIEQIMNHPWVREQFPVYLMTIHTEAIYQASRFARDSMKMIADQIDPEVIAYVATRFRMSPQRVAAVVSSEEAASMHLAAGGVEAPTRLVERSYSVADERVKPRPLEIPQAESKLRDEEHDVVVAYHILLDRKLVRRSAIEGSNSGSNGPPKHVDPTTGLPSSPQGPSENIAAASSLLSTRFGGAHPLLSAGGPMAVSAMEGYGSLRGFSLGPQSHKAPMVHTRAPGNLQRAPDGTMHFTPIFSHVGAASVPPPTGPFVDPYLAGYNNVLPTRLFVSQRGAVSVLGQLFQIPETCLEDVACNKLVIAAPRSAAASTPQQPTSSAVKRVPLLTPVVAEPEGQSAPTVEGAHSVTTSSCTPNANRAAANSNSSTAADTHAAGKFGGDFMHNGVAFRGSDAQATFKTLCTCLKVCGYLWRSLLPFSLVACRPNGEKIICKVFKIGPEDYLIDVRVSTHSGFGALDGATELLDLLLTHASLGSIGNRKW